jgi:hypothetical protein
MMFFFDHDVPEDTAFALEAMGHQVVRLREVLQTTRARFEQEAKVAMAVKTTLFRSPII